MKQTKNFCDNMQTSNGVTKSDSQKQELTEKENKYIELKVDVMEWEDKLTFSKEAYKDSLRKKGFVK